MKSIVGKDQGLGSLISFVCIAVAIAYTGALFLPASYIGEEAKE